MRLLTCLTVIGFAFNAHASGILDGVTISPELDGSDYNRKAHFGEWERNPTDGPNTRHKVLAQESLVPVTWSADGKTVKTGLWYGPFTQKTFTVPYKNRYAILQIDHIVPLKEAYESGAKLWNFDHRFAFANDIDNPGHLIAVDGPTNGAKGYKDPAEWIDVDDNFKCAYVLTWVAIKRKWGLTVDASEATAIRATEEEHC